MQGAANVVKALEGWAQALPPMAGFFEPCQYLKDCAQAGRKLGAGKDAGRSKL